jgi:hypothetical protein
MGKKMYPFKDLALGTRFKYATGGNVWVKISELNIAEWDTNLQTDKWIGQRICSFSYNNNTHLCVEVLKD